MGINQITVREKIIKEITSSDGMLAIPLFEYIPYSKLGYRILSESLKLENLEIRSFIYSIDSIKFPVFPIEASDSEIQTQIMELEWKSPRYHLNTMLSTDLTNWHRVGTNSLINSSPAPYREFLIGNFNLGNNAMLGFQIQNVGHGTLAGSDSIIISCDLVKDIQLEKISQGTPLAISLVADVATLLIPENMERVGFTIFNNSNNEIYLDIADTVSATDFLLKIPGQGYYESQSYLATSEIYAISTQSTDLIIREFS